MTDRFANYQTGLESPPDGLFDVTLHNTDELAQPTRAIMVTTAGNVKVTTTADVTGTMPALQPGVMYAIRAKIIWATGTTATGVVGFY